MPPPRAGSSGRKPLGRLVDALRRRLRTERGAPPATVPGLASGEEIAVAAAAKHDAAEAPRAELAADAERAVAADEPMPEGAEPAPGPLAEPGARIDAARERLRMRIDPPAPDDGASG